MAITTFTPQMLYGQRGEGTRGVPEIPVVSVSTDFKMTIKTDNAGTSADDSFYLKLANGTTNMTVDWGDGSSDLITAWNQSELTHQYASPGTYQLSLDGAFYGFNFQYSDHLKVMSIDNWGNNAFGTMSRSFWGCSNLIGTYTDIPNTSAVISFYQTFAYCTVFNSPVEFDTSSAITMNGMFWLASAFNQPLAFDTSKVTDMSGMFKSTTAFNQTINFDGSALITASAMFISAGGMNSPVTITNSTLLTNCSSMFGQMNLFNSDVTLDTTNVTTMASMFSFSSAFNGVLTFNGGTSNVTTMASMFYYASSFNQLVNFNTAEVTTMSNMFKGAASFNQSLSTFNTSKVTGTGMYSMFHNASSFNQPLAFDTSGITSMAFMLANTGMNSSINFDTSAVTTMQSMFHNASSLNVLPTFNDTSNVTTMLNMFQGCVSFDQDISGFDITNLTTAGGMFTYSGWTITNYDLLLVAWNAYGTSDVPFHAGTAHYSAGGPTTARAAMVSRGWTITDGGTP